jgi:hypothetical protein
LVVCALRDNLHVCEKESETRFIEMICQVDGCVNPFENYKVLLNPVT